ncbi:MAG TPA: hypothetical protein VI197_32075 [Polyangiaceae bacterium]
MADATTHEAPQTAAGPWQKRLIWAGVMILAAGASYVAGRVQTSSLIDAAEKETAAAEQKVTKESAKLSEQNRLLQRFEARRQLHLVLIALEERNFGIAKEHQTTAAALLQASEPTVGSELAKLYETMQKYQLVAREDLSAERAVIQTWAKRLDQELALPEGLRAKK